MDNSVLKRVITLIDMDCFYCQVELRLNPDLAGKPVAVVQYNQWKQGGIIAVNYEARDRGVTRFMRGEEATKVCPELCLASVPSVRGKADLTRYREAGAEVADVFSSFSDCVLRASVDEAFIDLTNLVEDRINSGMVDFSIEKLPSTFVVGHSNLKGNDLDDRRKGLNEWVQILKQNAHLNNPDYRLFVGALIVEEIRKEVLRKTGFHCSGGVAHNKILAKLVAGLHKPKCQTVIPHENVPELYETLPVKKVRNLGGKFGKTVSDVLSIKYMSELYNFSKEHLIEKFNVKNGTWLYEIARGIDHELVTSRLIAESIGCSKNFRGPVAIKTKEKLLSWLKDMAEEVVERLEKDLADNVRRAKLLTISFKQGRAALSRSCQLNAYKVESIAKDAYEIILKTNQAHSNSSEINPAIENLGLSASKFNSERTSIKSFLREKTIESTASTSSKLENEEDLGHAYNPDDQIFDGKGKIKAISTVTERKNITEKKTITSFFTPKLELQSATTSFTNLNLAKSSEPYLPTFSDDSNLNDHTTAIKGEKTISSFFKNKLEPFEMTGLTITPSAAAYCVDHDSDKIDSSKSNELGEPKSKEEGDSASTTLESKEMGKDEPVKPPVSSFFAKMLANKTEPPKNEEFTEVKDILDVPSTSATTSAVSDDDWNQVCPDCNEKIHLSVYIEHLDYHAALKLDHVINSKPIMKKAIPTNTSTKSKGSPMRKKRKTVRPIDQTEITTFFSSIQK